MSKIVNNISAIYYFFFFLFEIKLELIFERFSSPINSIEKDRTGKHPKVMSGFEFGISPCSHNSCTQSDTSQVRLVQSIKANIYTLYILWLTQQPDTVFVRRRNKWLANHISLNIAVLKTRSYYVYELYSKYIEKVLL